MVVCLGLEPYLKSYLHAEGYFAILQYVHRPFGSLLAYIATGNQNTYAKHFKTAQIKVKNSFVFFSIRPYKRVRRNN